MRQLPAPFALATLRAACSPVAILNGAAPQSGVETDRDIGYLSGRDHRLDLYAPSPRRPRAPVVVFFYGGGWEGGNRAMYRFLGAALARRGVVTVIPDYRKFPQVRFPAFMEDAASVLAWVRTHVAAYGGDPNRLFLMGHSAGAHIAVLLALDELYLREATVERSAIAGVIGLSGPYDFVPITGRTLKMIFGDEDAWPASQPVNFVSSDAPPMLLAAGTADRVVAPRNTVNLAAGLRAAGVPVTERLYKGVGHALTVGAFASPLALFPPSRRDTLAFISRHGAPSFRRSETRSRVP